MSGGTYDCIVVGAGMSGLTFAALMAKSNRRVLVVEKHYLPGGCFTAFKRSGENKASSYVFNVAMEWTTDGDEGEAFSNLLRHLDLQESYSFKKLSYFRSVLSPELPKRLDLHCSEQGFRRDLIAAFPSQQENIDRFVDDCLAVVSRAPQSQNILLKSGIKKVEAALANYFSDPLLIHLFYSMLDYPAARGIHLMFLVGSICNGNVYMPRHGDQRKLASLIHRKIKKCRGEVLYSNSVEEILVDNDVAYGVRLATGEEIRAPVIVACTDTEQLYNKLLGGSYSKTIQAERAVSRKPGSSSFCLFLGINGLFPEITAENHSYLLLASTQQWKADMHDFANAPLRVDFQSALYPKLAPPGKSTVCIRIAADISSYDYWGQSKDCEYEEMNRVRYENAKSQAVSVLLARLSAAFPGLSDQIEIVDAATPFTIRRYTHNTLGAIGASLSDLRSVAQDNSMTPVKGVYHVGHWTVASGVNSVMYSAFNLYQAISSNPTLN